MCIDSIAIAQIFLIISEMGELVFTSLFKEAMPVIRGVNVFPSQVEEMLLQFGALAPHYQLVLIRDGHLDVIDVLVEARDEASFAAAVNDGAALEQQIKAYIGVSCKIAVLQPNGLERTQTGKARRVVDKRNLN